MSIVVFLGPSLARSEAETLLDADYRPPVAQGDVYRAARERPWGIAIIDGYFERVPAVWHKEVLWALSQGIHVFGASSMGALRAAELHAFGMIGVGSIFEGFRDETLTDDDEVTIAHAGAELGFRPLSVAMVDIRATLLRAVRESVIDAATRHRLLELAKLRFYAERSYPQLCEDARAAGLARTVVDGFASWVRERAVSLKQIDARLLLRSLAHWRTVHPDSRGVDFRFEHTDAWQQLTRQIRATTARSDAEDRHAAVLAALRNAPEEYANAKARALARRLALLLAERVSLDAAALPGTIEAFRRERGLHSTDATQAWWEAHGLERGEFLELMQREAAIRAVGESITDLDADLLDELRTSGRYAELASRAHAAK